MRSLGLYVCMLRKPFVDDLPTSLHFRVSASLVTFGASTVSVWRPSCAIKSNPTSFQSQHQSSSYRFYSGQSKTDRGDVLIFNFFLFWQCLLFDILQPRCPSGTLQSFDVTSPACDLSFSSWPRPSPQYRRTSIICPANSIFSHRSPSARSSATSSCSHGRGADLTGCSMYSKPSPPIARPLAQSLETSLPALCKADRTNTYRLWTTNFGLFCNYSKCLNSGQTNPYR
jgi:hypothetical protein